MKLFTKNPDTNRTVLVADAPEWAWDMMRKAHDGELPYDWVWDSCAAIWQAMLEDEDEDDTIDGMVYIYDTDLLQWLISSPGLHMAYCDEAINELAPPSLAAALAGGQFLALRHIWGVLSGYFEEHAS